MSSLLAYCNADQLTRNDILNYISPTFTAVCLNTATAAILGGASLGTAIVTVGLPAGAVVLTATLLSYVFTEFLKKMNLVSYPAPNNPTIHFGIEAAKRAAIWLTIAGVTTFAPAFRINLLFTLTVTYIGLTLSAMRSGTQLPLGITLHVTSPWMDRLGVFVRA